jgi:hypothetical protein
MIETETIACPACNTEQEAAVYQTINAIENPELVPMLMKGKINLFRCTACGHEAQIDSPLLYNDYRIGLKIQYYPEHVLKENPEALCNDYLAMLEQLEKFRNDFSPFMPGLEKQDGLMVVFSMAEMVRQIKFRTQLFDVQRAAKVDGAGPD